MIKYYIVHVIHVHNTPFTPNNHIMYKYINTNKIKVQNQNNKDNTQFSFPIMYVFYLLFT